MHNKSIEFPNDMLTHLQLVVHDRLETLKHFIAETKAKPMSTVNAAMLTKLDADVQRTDKLLKHVCTPQPQKPLIISPHTGAPVKA